MRTKTILLRAVCLALTALAATTHAGESRDPGLETLHPENGWGASGPGVTGGAAAAPTQIYTVTNRRELIAALNNGVASSTSPSNPSNEPKIIYVKGVIDGNVDDENHPLACEDYYRNGYTLEAFLATYDPEVYGRGDIVGPLEDARLASRNAQQDRVRIRPGSNTTIVGVGAHAVIKGAWLDVRGSATNKRRNIIVRNLIFRDTYDCFPEWDPGDGDLGAWNALYDSISLRDTENVWIDHSTFEDRDTADATLPHHFGVLYQVHDGLLDITNASDLVTVSWNRFRDHDKMMLIGSSDSAAADRTKLRVTLHHNAFEKIGQRAPRVRFGQVHLYNNYYDLRSTPSYSYSWGVGVESAIYAEENFFLADRTFGPDQIIERFAGTALSASGTLLVGPRVRNPVDVVAAWNALNEPDLGFDAGWTPTLNHQLMPGLDYRAPRSVVRRPAPGASYRSHDDRAHATRTRRIAPDHRRRGRMYACVPGFAALGGAVRHSCRQGRGRESGRRARFQGRLLWRRYEQALVSVRRRRRRHGKAYAMRWSRTRLSAAGCDESQSARTACISTSGRRGCATRASGRCSCTFTAANSAAGRGRARCTTASVYANAATSSWSP